MTHAQTKPERHYLALGDSYTVGESVPQPGSFPYQLQAALNEKNLNVQPPQVVAKTGWTTGELLKALETAQLRDQYDLVTLLIGVNNQYRGYAPELYEKEFTELLEKAIGYAGGKKDRVFVVSIPDWGVTPFAAGTGRDRAVIATEIDAYNQTAKEICLHQGVQFIDITPGSRRAADAAELNAADGLHPSAVLYGEWVQALLPQVSVKF